MPTFEYEPLVLSLEPKTSNEEENKGDIDGVGPSSIRTTKEEPVDLRGGKESSNREAISKTCIITYSRTKKICCAKCQFLGIYIYRNGGVDTNLGTKDSRSLARSY